MLLARRMSHLLHQQPRVAATTFQSSLQSLQSFSSMKDRGTSVESKFFLDEQKEQLKRLRESQIEKNKLIVNEDSKALDTIFDIVDVRKEIRVELKEVLMEWKHE